MRRAWLAGSLPGDTPSQAMTLALDELGDCLLALPGGEIGDRNSWIASIQKRLERQTNLFKVTKPGNWSDYDDVPQLKPVGDLGDLDLGYWQAYQEEQPIAARLLKSRDLVLPFQVGIPSPFDFSMFALGPVRHTRYRKDFARATLRDVKLIAASGAPVVFQIEAPLETIACYSVPSVARPTAASFMAKQITNFVRQCPSGTRWGVHLCLGDLQHQAKVKLDSPAPSVSLVNAVMECWPTGRLLEWITLPLSAGHQPPVTTASWYTPLINLAVPDDVTVVAGLCHEDREVADLVPVVDFLDSLLKRTVAVGASCGLALRGDRTLDDALKVLRQMRALCT